MQRAWHFATGNLIKVIVEGIRKDHKGLLYFEMRKDEEGSKTCRRNALGKWVAVFSHENLRAKVTIFNGLVSLGQVL